MKITSDELYQVLRDSLISAKYAEGQVLPTLREFEKQYGLHRDTIIRILATLEGEGLITRRGRRCYPVRRHRSEDRVIALEHIFQTNEHPFFGPLNCGIVDTFLSSEFGVHLFTHRESKESSISSGAVMSNLLKRGILRGVVFSIGVPQPEDVNTLRHYGAAVCTMGVEPGPGVIVIDMEQAALQGTHYMAKFGFDRLGIVFTRDIGLGMDVKGYRQALALNDLPCIEEDIIDCSDFLHETVAVHVDPNIPQEMFVRESLKPIIEGAKQCILRRIRSGNFPRALYISDEFLAIGTMRALQEMGLRIPQDVAVVSHMSSGNWALELTGLTTVQFNGYSCGMEAARFIIDIAEGRRSANDRLILQARLVKGMSCGEMDDIDKDEVSFDTIM